jgi:predicted amidohydrolase
MYKIEMKEYINELIKQCHTNIIPSTCGIAYSNKDAFVRVEEDIKLDNGIWIHGLFSKKKGKGTLLLLSILNKYNNHLIRLNCKGEKLEEYYKRFGFNTYFLIDGYYEMFLDNRS